MVAADILEIDPTRGRYRLPNEHAACLTRASSPDNIAVFAQYIGLLGQVEDDILQCFQRGGGVPYERYGHFHEAMANAYPNSRFTGYDLSPEAVGRARDEGQHLGLTNALLEVRDVVHSLDHDFQNFFYVAQR